MLLQWWVNEKVATFFFFNCNKFNKRKQHKGPSSLGWSCVFIYLREIYSSKMREWAIIWQVFLLRHLWTPLEGIWLNLSKEERLRFLLWKFLHKSRTLSTLQKKRQHNHKVNIRPFVYENQHFRRINISSKEGASLTKGRH